jgi:hypothetical protein
MDQNLGNFNLDYEKKQKIYDKWLKTFTALDFIQVVKETTWEKIHNNNNVQSSFLDHVFVDDLTALETITVDKQPIGYYSIFCSIT